MLFENDANNETTTTETANQMRRRRESANEWENTNVLTVDLAAPAY